MLAALQPGAASMRSNTLVLFAALALAGCAQSPERRVAKDAAVAYDLLITNGVVYDGSGEAPKRVDVAVRGDRVVALLEPGSGAKSGRRIDANGQAVAPGFINILSWATESLIEDGRGMSDTKQ